MLNYQIFSGKGNNNPPAKKIFSLFRTHCFKGQYSLFIVMSGELNFFVYAVKFFPWSEREVLCGRCYWSCLCKYTLS
jgi:hypothetical protein